MIKRTVMIAIATLGLTACGPRHPEIVMPAGHPADPYSRAGKAASVPEALRPEIITAVPKLKKAGG